MAEIFISYARSDEALARRVAGAVKARGFDVWWDEQLPAHRAYGDVIEQRLRSADAVIVLWSKAAVQSQWVRAEADLARTEGKLVQVLLDGTIPPLPFNQIQCADLKGWRGNAKHPGWVKLLESVTAVAAGERDGSTMSARAAAGGGSPRRWWWIAGLAAALIVIAAVVGLRLLAPPAAGPTTLAVLPFKSHAAADASLADGLWEDTRQALSRNPQLRVIGRQTIDALSEQNLEPRQYRSKLDIDYLLDGTIRRTGERVRVSVSLVNTRDGSQVWSDTFERNLDDIFELQTEVAGEIEGRIRGRLARAGGVQPDNIATSGAVYLLFSEARAAVFKRDFQALPDARRKLLQAVRMDPNFAPAWAALAVADRLMPATVNDHSTNVQSESHARRAITLAPNLASAHAALGFANGLSGPVAEAALRRAIELDPNDVQSINWLASIESRQGRAEQTLALYDRAIEIEPLWWPVVLNRLNLLLTLGRDDAVDAELARIRRSGDPNLAARGGATVLTWRGDMSEALKIAIAVNRRLPEANAADVGFRLLQLGYFDEAVAIGKPPPFAPALWKNDPRGLDQLEKSKVAPAAFWEFPPLAENAGRVYVLSGRGAGLARWYRAGANSPERLLAAAGYPERFVHLAPTVALALRQAGDSAEADRLLAAADAELARQPKRPTAPRDQAIMTARLRSVQGRSSEAAAALGEAVRLGWWPDPPAMLIDIATDPPLALLKDMPEFQRARARILANAARERAELGPVSLPATAPPPVSSGR